MIRLVARISSLMKSRMKQDIFIQSKIILSMNAYAYVCVYLPRRYDAVALAVDLQGRSKAGRVMQNGPQYALARQRDIYQCRLNERRASFLSPPPQPEIN